MDDTRINISRVITTGKIVGIPEQRTSIKKHGREDITAFEEIFRGALEKEEAIRFSKHASERMERRNIHLSSGELAKIKEAMDKADAKGVKDSLVLMRGTAFIVNVPSRTVITAVSGESMKDNVFTNIDGAVII